MGADTQLLETLAVQLLNRWALKPYPPPPPQSSLEKPEPANPAENLRSGHGSVFVSAAELASQTFIEHGI